MDTSELKKLKDEQDILSRANNAAKLEIESLERVKNDVNRSIKDATASLDEVEKTISYKRDEAKNISDEISALKDERLTLTSNIERGMIELASVKDKISSLFEKEQEEQYTVLESVNDDISHKKSEVIGLAKNIYALTSELNTLNANIGSGKVLLNNLSCDIDKKNTVMASHNDLIDSLRKDIVEKNSILSSLNIDITTAITRRDNAINETSNAQKEYDSLRNSIKTLQSEKDKKQDEYTLLTRKVFAISQRESALNDKEDFIKEQFNRAGIEYGKN